MLNTVEHLRALGIRDRWLEEVGRLVQPPGAGAGGRGLYAGGE